MENKALLVYILTLLFALAALFSTIAQETDQRQQPTPEQINQHIDEWLKSPITYIITKAEANAFKKLTSREEKIQFINYFWLRRDPNPRTTVNEFRDEFYTRVATANHHFKVGKKEGWKTHRGQLFIIFGPPQEIHRGITPALRSYETWTYYRLKTRKLSSQYSIIFIDWIGNRDYKVAFGNYLGKSAFERRMDLLHFIPRAGYIPPDLVSGMDDMKKLAIVNQDIEIKDVPVSTKMLSTLPFKFYRATLQTGNSEVRTLLGISLNYKDVSFSEIEDNKLSPTITIEASLLDNKKEIIDTFKQELSFSIDADELNKRRDDSFIYWRGLRTKPGEYFLNITVEDRISGASSVWEKEVEIPSLKNKKLKLTEVILADAIAPTTQTEVDEDAINTMWLMGYQIIPNVESLYTKDSNLCIFLQLINLKLDDQSSNPSVEITCSIFKDDKVFSEVKLPASSFTMKRPGEIVAYYCIPLADFSPGEYTLYISAKDNIANQETSRRLDFEVKDRS